MYTEKGKPIVNLENGSLFVKQLSGNTYLYQSPDRYWIKKEGVKIASGKGPINKVHIENESGRLVAVICGSGSIINKGDFLNLKVPYSTAVKDYTIDSSISAYLGYFDWEPGYYRVFGEEIKINDILEMRQKEGEISLEFVSTGLITLLDSLSE